LICLDQTKKLTHDICLEDLGEDARKFLSLGGGGLHVLPQRDNAGRRVIFAHAVLNGSESDADTLKARKAYFYFWTTLSEEDNEQGKVKGIVGIMWKVHDAKTSDPYVMQALVKIWQCSPVKLSAYHVCHGPKSLNLRLRNNFARMIIPFFDDSGDFRLYRSHYGKAMECMYSLFARYGCPTHLFPLNYGSLEEGGYHDNHTPLFHVHHVGEWMASRVPIDEERKQMNCKSINLSLSVATNKTLPTELLGRSNNSLYLSVNSIQQYIFDRDLRENDDSDLPEDDDSDFSDRWGKIFWTDKMDTERTNESGETTVDGMDVDNQNECRQIDILLGRGKPLQRHVGNLWFREFVANHFDAYVALEKTKMTEMAENIVQQVKREGRRFLTQAEDGSWTEIDDHKARDKVSYTFRTERKEREKGKEKKTESLKSW